MESRPRDDSGQQTWSGVSQDEQRVSLKGTFRLLHQNPWRQRGVTTGTGCEQRRQETKCRQQARIATGPLMATPVPPNPFPDHGFRLVRDFARNRLLHTLHVALYERTN